MPEGIVYHETANSLASAGDFIIAGNAASTGAAEVHELAGSGAAEIYKESDPDGDGSFEVSVLIDSFSGEWHSQQNGFIVSAANRTRLRVSNTSGAAADYYATGMDIADNSI